MAKRTRVPTGITALDRELTGGIPTGSIVSVSAHPASQAELLLYTMSMKGDRELGRDTYYITTERSSSAIRDSYNRSPTNSEVPNILDVDAESPLDSASDRIKVIPEDSNVIIDTVNVLEDADPVRYRRFLNQLQTHMINTGGIAMLYALDGESAIPDNRDITLNMSDLVFDLETRREGGEVINELAVPKFRGGRALDETLKLELTDTVDIDTSRDIA